MTDREYRQDDRTEGYCPRCGEPLAAMTTGARGYCETHGWQYADWRASGYWSNLPTVAEREAQP